MNERTLSVLTQNAWGGAPFWSRRCERLAQTIAFLDPDLVGLQEVHAPTPAGDGSQAHELAALLGYEAWFAPGRVTASGHAEGVALLVKPSLVVRSRSVFPLSLDGSDPLEGPHQRVVLRAAVELGDVVVDALVTHLSLSRRARERTLVELQGFAAAERVRSGSVGAVLMGDFNATPEEPALDALAAAGWTDAWAHVSGGRQALRGGTWPSAAPFRRIDYVWVQRADGWRIDGCTRTPVSGSDHVGLVTILRWPEGGTA